MRMCGVLLALVTAYVVSAVPVEKLPIDGDVITVGLEAEPDVELLNNIDRDTSDNVYSLFTRRNPQTAQTLVMDDDASILNSNFNGRLPTVVITHGWLSQHQAAFSSTVRDAFLGSNDVNVIYMSWSQMASSDYTTASQAVIPVARALGNFLAYLNRMTGAQIRSCHLVGLGLGAHLVGNAGRHLGGRVARVTGLDPADSLWSSNENRLRPGDAIYTEAIHTNGGKRGLGIGSAIADVDFFPNGGRSQPGCLTNICEHNRAWELFASTITHNHLVGRRCTTNHQIVKSKCRGEELHMGNDILTKTGSGMYRVDTTSTYPF